MYAAFGLGRDIDVIGGYSAYGFGILALFPDGIITIVRDIVYRELRLCHIGQDNRIQEVEEDILL